MQPVVAADASRNGGGRGGWLSGWLVSGQLEGGWLEYSRQTIDGVAFSDPNRARVDVGLLSLSAAASHRSGLGFDLLLPVPC